MSTEDSRPKVFISYCWDLPLTVERVHAIADYLDGHGVYLEMDRYQPAGSNLYRFMEQMVEDRSIDKVLCFVDRAYHRKSLLGQGGVGTEVTILTPEVYKHAASGDLANARIVPILFETPEDPTQPMPTMFATAKYEYMVDPSSDERHMEQLLRVAHGRPAFVRSVGTRAPAHLLEPDNAFGSEVSAFAVQVGYHLKQGKTKLGLAAFEDHLQALLAQLTRTDTAPAADTYHAQRTEVLTQEVQRRLGLLRAYGQALEAYLKYGEDPAQPLLARFFEALLAFTVAPSHTPRAARDTVRLLARELFTLTTALYLRHRRYAELHDVIDGQYRVPHRHTWHEYDYLALEPEDLRDDAFLSRISQAIWEGVDLPMDEASQAELVLVVWGYVQGQAQVGWPHTNVRVWQDHVPDLFQRVRNAATVVPLTEVFGVDTLTLLAQLRAFEKHMGHGRVNWSVIFALDQLAQVVNQA